MMRWLCMAVALAAASPAAAECVAVMYRDTCVDLSKLECTTTQSSFVHQVCYDQKNEYMVILLNTTRYHYCGIPKDVVTALTYAASVGRFYNASVKGRFGCEGQPIPSY